MARWDGWSAVPGGGRTFSAPAVTMGHGLRLVVRGRDDGVHHNRFDGSSWDGWQEVPGVEQTSSAPGALAIDRALTAFIRHADGGIHWNALTHGSNGWRGWEEIPGGGRTPSGPAALAYHRFDLGLIDPHVFVRGTDDGIHFNSLSEGRWTGWRAVPGGGRTPSTPAVASVSGAIPGTNELHLCVRGTDDGLHHNRFDGSDWSGWSAVPGGGRTFDTPAAVEFAGELHLFVRGTDDGLHFNRFDGSWSGWSAVPGGGRTPSAPAVTVFDGDLYLLVRGTDDGLHFNRLS